MWFPSPLPAARRATREPPIGPAGAPMPAAMKPGAASPLRNPGTCSCGGACPRCRGAASPAPVPTSQPGDASEHAAHAAAQRILADGPLPDEAPRPAVGDEGLSPRVRRHLERHLGADLGDVRLHQGPAAQASARSLGASAYTLGQDIVMGAGWRAGTPAGQRLLAHEAAHAAQVRSGQAPAGVAHRQFAGGGGGFSSSDADLAAEREYGSGRPAHCPPGFCDPYRTVALAEYYRAKNGPFLMLGIAAAVNSRVVPLWRDYLNGGTPARDLTPSFGADFTASPTTARTSAFVRRALQLAVPARLAGVPVGAPTTVSLPAFLPHVAATLDNPASADQMNFNIPGDIPGNLAGGLGKDQTACPSGALPSPFDDERRLRGSARVERLDASRLRVTPDIRYTVRDTIDLCPGDCGTLLEQVATVPLSQFEATGIAGDVPFSVDFPAPATANAAFEVSATATATATPTPTPPPAPAPGPAPQP